MTKQEALNILKPESKTKEALKKAYRIAGKKYHPDHGGDEEMMKLVNLAFETLKPLDWSDFEEKASKKMDSLDEEIAERWEKIKTWGRIKGELIGTWLWVSGETWRYKKFLKEMSFRWSPNKKSWYWHNQKGYRKRNGKSFSMKDIRDKWGSTMFEGVKAERINS